MSRSTWLTGFMAAGLAIFAGWPGQARADGEVGLVVENAGVATTYCIAYSGDGITGEELLRRAGYSIEQFGGSGGRTVCAIGETGCKDASSFTSCFCQCQGANCVYWAFFTREYGKNWVYSALAFNLLKAADGDVHGWRWGAGGLHHRTVRRGRRPDGLRDRRDRVQRCELVQFVLLPVPGGELRVLGLLHAGVRQAVGLFGAGLQPAESG